MKTDYTYDVQRERHSYASMTIKEKIRHNRIEAAAIRRKAGPMFSKDKGHMTWEEMPEPWKTQILRAKELEAEATDMSRSIQGSYGNDVQKGEEILQWARNWSKA